MAHVDNHAGVDLDKPIGSGVLLEDGKREHSRHILHALKLQ